MRRLIVCETRGGFHASFGRGDPYTRYQEKMRDFVPVGKGFGAEASGSYLSRNGRGKSARRMQLMSRNLTPNPFFRARAGKGNQSRSFGF
jgi:hypothetical protein